MSAKADFRAVTHAPVPPIGMRMPVEDEGAPLCLPQSEDCPVAKPGGEITCWRCLRKLRDQYAQYANFLRGNGVTFAIKQKRPPRPKKVDPRQTDFADLEER